MKQTLYVIQFLFWFLISLLPFWILYGISDLLFLIAYHVWGYRKALVRKQLDDSFPELTESERRAIEKDYYHWFCDYIVETLKLFCISRKNLMRRMRFEGTERVEQSYRQGQNVVVYLGHYCNWEWVTSTPLCFKRHLDRVTFGQIYHKLENESMNNLLLRLRGRMGAESIPMAETLRRLVTIKREGKLWTIGFIADQVPYWNNIHLWLDFLNHDTPVLTGGERIAARFDSDVYYLDMRREKRGHYVGRYVLIAEHASRHPESEITRTYFRLLEKSIRRQPAFYLWTHNRWKRTHEEFNIRYDAETGRVDLGDLKEIKKRKAIVSEK